MKCFTLFCLSLILFGCSSDEESSSSNFGNHNTLLKEATVSNDTEGKRTYVYDANYNLTQIKNSVKTITFSYYPLNASGYYSLKSIVWVKGSETRKVELAYDEFEEMNGMTLTLNGQVNTIPCSRYEDNWNYLKLDFGTYYELLLEGSGGIKQIRRIDAQSNEIIEPQSYYFSYYDPASFGPIDYGYGRNSDRTWMLFYLDKEEFLKIPLSYYAIDTIGVLGDNGAFQQHSHVFDEEVLVSTKIHFMDEVYHNVSYKFDKLTPKTD